MRAALAFATTFLLFAGCITGAPEPASDEGGLVIDADRPAPKFGEIVTGPAVGPDVNATTKAAPRLAEGEWWRIRFDSPFAGTNVEVVRVVANATAKGYILGMPH
ncbi:MAG TPA: hypothetical protein VI796_00960, partial [Candidatus Thermoplasmatota archaeon]|nr:hypothetical protein [Candidatus Thermoplasmatota archaeon]